MSSNKFAISVMSDDRVGIISAVTGGVFNAGGNIDRISQTVVDGCFIIMMLAEFGENLSAADVQHAIQENGKRFDLEVNVRPYVEPLVRDQPRNIYFLSAIGNDRAGIFHEITSVLAGRDVNILDLYCYVRENKTFVLIGEVDLPEDMDLERLQIDLESGHEKEQLRLRIQHENLFRATNELYIQKT
jgi:glycine cleavage system transcriptional repressor